MTEAEITELFSEWQSRLGLDDWDIRIIFQSCSDPEHGMECHRVANYQRATIVVRPDLVDWEEPEDWVGPPAVVDRFYIEQSCVHELLHCVFRDLVFVSDLFDGMLQQDVETTVHASYKKCEEATVDRLAYALVRAWNG